MLRSQASWVRDPVSVLCLKTLNEVVWALLLTDKQMGMMNLTSSMTNFVKNTSKHTSHFF
jgi:hypothetical protein